MSTSELQRPEHEVRLAQWKKERDRLFAQLSEALEEDKQQQDTEVDNDKELAANRESVEAEQTEHQHSQKSSAFIQQRLNDQHSKDEQVQEHPESIQASRRIEHSQEQQLQQPPTATQDSSNDLMDSIMNDVEHIQIDEDKQSKKAETAEEKKRRIEAFYEAQPKGVFRVGNPLMGYEEIRYPTICEADRVRLRKRIADHDAKEAEEKQKMKRDNEIMAKAKEMKEQVDQDRMDTTSANNGPSHISN